MELRDLFETVRSVAGAAQSIFGEPAPGFYPGTPAGGFAQPTGPSAYNASLFRYAKGENGEAGGAPSASDLERWLMGVIPGLVPGGAGAGTPAACITATMGEARLRLPKMVSFASPVRDGATEYYVRATLGPADIKRAVRRKMFATKRAGCRPRCRPR